MGPGLWKRVRPIHLYGQDVGSVASLQNTRGREGGREIGRGGGRVGGRDGGREGGRNGTDGGREYHVSVNTHL